MIAVVNYGWATAADGKMGEVASCYLTLLFAVYWTNVDNARSSIPPPLNTARRSSTDSESSFQNDLDRLSQAVRDMRMRGTQLQTIPDIDLFLSPSEIDVDWRWDTSAFRISRSNSFGAYIQSTWDKRQWQTESRSIFLHCFNNIVLEKSIFPFPVCTDRLVAKCWSMRSIGTRQLNRINVVCPSGLSIKTLSKCIQIRLELSWGSSSLRVEQQRREIRDRSGQQSTHRHVRSIVRRFFLFPRPMLAVNGWLDRSFIVFLSSFVRQ